MDYLFENPDESFNLPPLFGGSLSSEVGFPVSRRGSTLAGICIRNVRYRKNLEGYEGSRLVKTMCSVKVIRY